MITTDITADLVRGIAELEETPRGLTPHRLPGWVRKQYPDPQLLSMEVQPSGVRLTFTTEASQMALETHPSRVVYRGADRPRGCLQVLIDDQPWSIEPLAGGDAMEVDLATGAVEQVPGPSHTTVLHGLPAGQKRVEIWLPHNEALELIGLRSDAPLQPIEPDRPLWVHHGSSISQGSNAAAPAGIWPAVAARRGGVELRNLGLGGSSIVDPFMARVIRDTPADLVSLNFGINIVNTDAMRVRALVPAIHGFLDTIRDGHPTTPIVLISPIFCPIHESTSGPGAIAPESLGTSQVKFTATGTPGDESAGRLTLEVIRREMHSLMEHREEDRNLYFLDGLGLYGASDENDLPLPDNLHPDAATHQLIGDRFADYAFSVNGPFAAVPRH
ncbi:GDSL-type esterase/lipase family protein [Arthrobacter rhombi]|uniref:GDSL-type esterase/lipase family protein n=1 Tax=Arthrobacter rhombi TaxID=71253 RepID=UPI003F8EFCCC